MAGAYRSVRYDLARRPGPRYDRTDVLYPEYDAYEADDRRRRATVATGLAVVLAATVVGVYFAVAGGMGVLLAYGSPGSAGASVSRSPSPSLSLSASPSPTAASDPSASASPSPSGRRSTPTRRATPRSTRTTPAPPVTTTPPVYPPSPTPTQTVTSPPGPGSGKDPAELR